jgi:hypothetical protein
MAFRVMLVGALLAACSGGGSPTGDGSGDGKDDKRSKSMCGSLTQRGDCKNNVISYCVAGSVFQVDCQKYGTGQICQWVSDTAGWACVDPPAQQGGTCPASLTAAGTCNLDHLGGSRCDATTQRIDQFNCGAGTVCSTKCADKTGQASCCAFSSFGDPECDQVGYGGRCVGSVIHYCNDNGEVHQIDCGAAGRACSERCPSGQTACCN